MSKRGQITIFIILGIVILLSSALFFYAKNSELGAFKPYQGRAGPVEEFVDRCLSEISIQAINLASAQGGFVEIPLQYIDPSHHLNEFPGVPRDISSIVPYWYFNGERKNPTESEMKSHLRKYIEDNLDFCLNNFNAFEAEYNIEEKSIKRVDIILNNDDTTIKLDYIIDITPKGSNETTSRDSFIINVDVPLLRLYNLAVAISIATSEKEFFEILTMDIAALMPTDGENAFPLSDLSMFKKPKFWFSWEIKENLQNVLRDIYPGIRVKETFWGPTKEFDAKDSEYEKYRGIFSEIETIPDELIFEDTSIGGLVPAQNSIKTRDPKEILIRLNSLYEKDAPQDAYAYFHYVLDIEEQSGSEYDYRDLEANVQYKPDWGMNLIVTPSSNGVLQPVRQDVKYELLQFLSINYYFFHYDIQYPVLINLRAPDANGGKGHVFKFALPVIIKDNEPDKTGLVDEYETRQDNEPSFCDIRTGSTVNIHVSDAVFHIPVNDARITYTCFDQVCTLGQTQATTTGSGKLTTTIPDGCFGGIIEASKDDGIEKFAAVRDQIYEDELFLEMYRLFEVPVDFRKIKVSEISEYTNSTIPRFLQDNEKALVILETKDPIRHSQFLEISGNGGSFDIPANQKLDLIADNDVEYDLSVYLFRDGELLIGGYMDTFKPEILDAIGLNYLELKAFEVDTTTPGSQDSQINIFNFINNETKTNIIGPVFK